MLTDLTVAVRDLLKALEAAVPPPGRAHHCLTYACADYLDKLVLGVWVGDEMKLVYIDNGDLNRPTAELVSGIRELLHV